MPHQSAQRILHENHDRRGHGSRTLTLADTAFLDPVAGSRWSIHERLNTRAIDDMKAKTAAANAPWNMAMSRSSASTRPPPNSPCTITAEQHTKSTPADPAPRFQATRPQAANTMLTQPIVMPARRWPCSTNLSPAERSQWIGEHPLPVRRGPVAKGHSRVERGDERTDHDRQQGRRGGGDRQPEQRGVIAIPTASMGPDTDPRGRAWNLGSVRPRARPCRADRSAARNRFPGWAGRSIHKGPR